LKNPIVYEPKLKCNVPMLPPKYLEKIIECYKKMSEMGLVWQKCFGSPEICKAGFYCQKLHFLIYDCKEKYRNYIFGGDDGAP
jgi:hypothetical protein